MELIFKLGCQYLLVQNLQNYLWQWKKFSKPKRQEKSKDETIKNIRNLFKIKIKWN